MKRIIDVNEHYFKQLQTELKNSPDYPNLDYCQIIIASSTPYEERPQGEWIELPNYRHKCSICNISADALANLTEQLSNYCPNCGAKMKGSTE